MEVPNEFRNVDANEWVCTHCKNVVPAIPKPAKKPGARPSEKRVCGLCGSGSLIPAGTPLGIKILSPLGTEVIGKLKNPPRNPVGILGVIGFMIVLSGLCLLAVKVGILKMPKPKAAQEQHELTVLEKQALASKKLEVEARKKTLESQTKTFKYFQEKAQKGDAYAQYRLGMNYINGEGVTNDLSDARAWLEKSAAQGQAEAQKALTNAPLGIPAR